MELKNGYLSDLLFIFKAKLWKDCVSKISLNSSGWVFATKQRAGLKITIYNDIQKRARRCLREIELNQFYS